MFCFLPLFHFLQFSKGHGTSSFDFSVDVSFCVSVVKNDCIIAFGLHSMAVESCVCTLLEHSGEIEMEG